MNGIDIIKFSLEDASLARLLSVTFGQNVVSGSFASVPTLAFKIFKIQIETLSSSQAAVHPTCKRIIGIQNSILFSIVTSSGRAMAVG